MVKMFDFQSTQMTHEKTNQVYNTQCPYCSMQCKMQLSKSETNKYKVVGIDNPTTGGRICIKGRFAHEHAFDPNRILTPLLKVDGEFRSISWQEAYAYIKEKVTITQKTEGNDAVAVYGSGSVTNEEAYLLGKFARVALKTRYIDYNGRLCMSAAASAAVQTFGMDRGFTNSLQELPFTSCILLIGTNIAESQPTMMPYLLQAKKNGATIIAIDPRRTATTKQADVYLKIKPGTDAALANGILKVIIEENLVDFSFIQERVSGYQALKAHISSVSLQEVAQQTDIEESVITEVARLFAKADSGMIFTARGVEQQTDGVAAVRNFLNILLVTGKIGKQYSGYGAITGQGNGQGAREHGQKADQLPGYRLIENKVHRKEIAEVWNIEEEELPQKGVSAVELFQKMNDGEIKGMFVMCSNPVVSLPNATFVKEAIKKLSFLVVIDLFLSETAKLADLVLPTTSFLESEGTFTNLEGRVIWREANHPIAGEVKHDWEIICDIAKELGKGEAFSFSSAKEIFDELRLASRGGVADYYGITYERIKENGGILWPCPNLDHPGTTRLFENGFAHPDKKAKLAVVSNNPAEAKEERNQTFPLYLTTGRVMSHYQTGVLTNKSEALIKRASEPFIEIHPDTAAAYYIKENDKVLIQSKRGSIILKSKFTKGIRKDTVFIPFHWESDQHINQLVSDALDPSSRMPSLKFTTVNIKPMRQVE